MSTQSEREAAARVFAAGGAFKGFDAAVDAPEGWYLPDGTDSGENGWVELDEVLDRWKAYVRALDAAKTPDAPAREADALEGVVWRDAAAVLRHAECDTADEWDDVAGGDRQRYTSAWNALGHDEAAHVTIAAHARAQLAREAHKAAPTQPEALTLEQARAMCREAGDTVVEAEWVSAPAVLRYCEATEAFIAAQNAERAAFMTLCEEDRRRFSEGIADPPTVAAILRALGVTPAVLS